MRCSAKKDAALVLVLLIILSIIFKFVLMPMYQLDIKNELTAATEQLEP